MRLIIPLYLVLFVQMAQARFQASFSPETPLDRILVTEAQGAQTHLDIAVYTFSSPDLLNELVKARDRGVQIRLLVRKSADKGPQDFLKPLKERGVEIRSISKINHHKFMIIDRRVLVNSSANFSQTSLQRSYDENLIVCDTCRAHVQAYQEEFDFLWAHSNRLDRANDAQAGRIQNSRPLPPKRPVALFTSRNYEAHYETTKGQIVLKESPDDEHGEVELALIRAIQKSRRKIQVATGHFRSWPLLQALAQAVQRGIQVQVVLDGQEYVSVYMDDLQQKESAQCQLKKTENQCLRSGYHLSRRAWQQGIDVRMKSYGLRWNFMRSPQMHNKYMIIDGKTVYSGSYNWSYNAEFQSAENVFISSDPTLVRDFEANFARLWDYGAGVFTATRDSLRAQKQKLPYAFAPITMSYPELDEIRQIACEKCPSVFCSSDSDERDLGNSPDFCPITGGL